MSADYYQPSHWFSSIFLNYAILGLGRDNEIGPETIRLEANETKIYFGQNVTFTCNGAGAYYRLLTVSITG